MVGLFFSALYLGMSFLSTYLCIDWNFADEHSGGIGWIIGSLISFAALICYMEKEINISYVFYAILPVMLGVFIPTVLNVLFNHILLIYIFTNVIVCLFIFYCVLNPNLNE